MKNIYLLYAVFTLAGVATDAAEPECKIDETAYLSEAFSRAESGKVFAEQLNACKNFTFGTFLKLDVLKKPNTLSSEENILKLCGALAEYSILRKEKIPPNVMMTLTEHVAYNVESPELKAESSCNAVQSLTYVYANHFDLTSLTLENAKSLGNIFSKFTGHMARGQKYEEMRFFTKNEKDSSYLHFAIIYQRDYDALLKTRNDIQNVVSKLLLQAICDQKHLALTTSTQGTNANANIKRNFNSKEDLEESIKDLVRK
jgi:hypothetical protein